MEADRRVVRVASAFFEDLERQLGPDRGEDGEPSVTDFLVIDLPTFVDDSQQASRPCRKSSAEFMLPVC